MFDNTSQQSAPQKLTLSKEAMEEIQIPIQKADPVEVSPPPPQKADLTKIPGHKKLWIVFSVIFGVIVVGVGGVFAAHLSGIINVPIVDTILKRDIVDVATLVAKIADVQSAQSDVEITVAIEPETSAAKSIDNEFLSGLAKFLPIDTKLALHVSSFMSSEAEKPEGTLAVSGTYTSGGTSLSADIEARIVDGVTYIKANTLPSIPSFSFSEFIGKWVELPSVTDIEQQLDEFSLPVGVPTDLPISTEGSQQFLQDAVGAAQGTGFVTLSKRLSVEELDGIIYNTYALEFDATQTENFVTQFLKSQRDVCAEDSACLLSTLDGSDFSKQTDADIAKIAQSTTTDPTFSPLVSLLTDTANFHVWIAQDGSAYRILFALLINGSSQADQLSGKQIRLEISSLVSHINEQPTVEKPHIDLTMDDIERITRGYSAGEWTIVQQKSRIQSIRDSLNAPYPETLTGVAATSGLTDLYSNLPYPYTTDGTTYTLQYEIQKPAETATIGDLLDEVVVGTNTADKYVLSREAESSRDTDADGMTGAQELAAGTDPFSADTDADGATDLEEVQAGTDPLNSESNPSIDIGTDTDGDGLTDKQEELYGTNPKLKDTDLDGFSDKNEIDAGYNPLSTSSVKTYGMRVSDSDWIRGADNARITVVGFCAFSDVATPCTNYYTYLKTLLTTYQDDVRIVYKHLPKEVSSSALECAGVQGKFFEMHDKMLSEGKNYTVASMNIWAESLGLDTTAFAACLNNNEEDDRVTADILYADLLFIQAVPATLVNGTIITGAQTSLITKAIEDQLSELNSLN